MLRGELELMQMAARQAGVFHREQAVEIGLSDRTIVRRVREGCWTKVFPRVYSLAGNPVTSDARAMAALLWAGRGSALSHTTAAEVLKLDGVPAGPPHVSVANGRSRPPAGLRLHRVELASGDVTKKGPFRLTTVARTLVDLGSVQPPTVVEAALFDALRRRLTTVSQLRRKIEETCSSGKGGWRHLASLLETLSPGGLPLESRLELRGLRAISKAGLPKPTPQYRVYRDRRVVARLDFAFPELKLGVECESFAFHASPAALARDRSKRDELTLLGWRLIHTTWEELTNRPDAFIDRLTRALSARSQTSADRCGQGEPLMGGCG